MSRRETPAEGARHWLCTSLLTSLYASTRRDSTRAKLRRFVLRLERGPVYSETVRELYRRHHDLDVGLYTIGPCEAGPANYGRGITIGRYSSIYYTVRIISEAPKTDAIVPEDLLHEALGRAPVLPAPATTRLEIGHDVFIGHNSIILPSASRIGHGAVIGAGSVVQQPIPPYAVVTGNPARVVRFRFSEPKIRELLEEQWWNRSIRELAGRIEEFQRPLEGDGPIR